MSADFFLKIDGIEGECTKRGHEKEIDIHSMSFGVSQPLQVGRGGAGLSAGKASFGEIHFTKFTDKASPKLFQAAGGGTHIPSVVFTSQKAAGDKPMLYYKVTLTDVMVSSFQNAGASGSEMTEQVSIGYSKIEFEYIEQGKTGGAGAKNMASFNVVEGEAA
ncbi:type VI secretion system tube protein Hcp [Sphingomonas sp.]|jgi:type VI secretion system secreted protein Hcp|uniref:Hcp family type VI secretion system effector n=1 Tax=Sphingomonas sp. TaxID=28214 RepID=UPI002D7EE8A3|nr:type VI secretion system tube protein Hcp [Sphingomonas sp.]HEU0044672.1 type VI secretion system tube protein Hcp [Sphingomonas sp.]